MVQQKCPFCLAMQCFSQLSKSTVFWLTRINLIFNRECDILRRKKEWQRKLTVILFWLSILCHKIVIHLGIEAMNVCILSAGKSFSIAFPRDTVFTVLSGGPFWTKLLNSAFKYKIFRDYFPFKEEWKYRKLFLAVEKAVHNGTFLKIQEQFPQASGRTD